MTQKRRSNKLSNSAIAWYKLKIKHILKGRSNACYREEDLIRAMRNEIKCRPYAIMKVKHMV